MESVVELTLLFLGIVFIVVFCKYHKMSKEFCWSFIFAFIATEIIVSITPKISAKIDNCKTIIEAQNNHINDKLNNIQEDVAIVRQDVEDKLKSYTNNTLNITKVFDDGEVIEILDDVLVIHSDDIRLQTQINSFTVAKPNYKVEVGDKVKIKVMQTVNAYGFARTICTIIE